MELLELIKENPGLPVTPMVNYEIVGDDGYKYWVGSFGKARVTEYCSGEEHIHFREDNDLDETLPDFIGYNRYEELSDDDAEKEYDALPWIKAIVVYIEMPTN